MNRPEAPWPTDAETLKACCTAAYEHDLVALLLGESYHPGGLDLTRHLARALDLRPGRRVLDVAAGPGATACLLAAEFGVDVDGIDLGAASVERARATGSDRGLDGRVHFQLGDAEHLPFDDATFDVVICECAWCTFPHKATAQPSSPGCCDRGVRSGSPTSRSTRPDSTPNWPRWPATWPASPTPVRRPSTPRCSKGPACGS
ncbi:MAG: methyltransferase domain-containing protein [Acidimicrobiia bacterium]